MENPVPNLLDQLHCIYLTKNIINNISKIQFQCKIYTNKMLKVNPKNLAVGSAQQRNTTALICDLLCQVKSWNNLRLRFRNLSRCSHSNECLIEGMILKGTQKHLFISTSGGKRTHVAEVSTLVFLMIPYPSLQNHMPSTFSSVIIHLNTSSPFLIPPSLPLFRIDAVQ